LKEGMTREKKRRTRGEDIGIDCERAMIVLGCEREDMGRRRPGEVGIQTKKYGKVFVARWRVGLSKAFWGTVCERRRKGERARTIPQTGVGEFS